MSELEKKFETIEKGSYSGLTIAGQYVIKDKAELQDLYSVMHSNRFPAPTAPKLNFKKELVLGVALGTKPTGGYGISIDKIVELDSVVEVYYSTHSPKPGMMRTMAITSPYHVVKTERTNKPVEFYEFAEKFPFGKQ